MFFELVLGEGGVYPGESHFFRTLMKEVREHGVAVVVDEVQTFGRTPEAFAFQFFALDDLVDLVAVGKLSQVCATVFRKEYRPRPGLVGQTFTGSTAAILSARVVLTELLRGDYFGPNGKNARLQNRFEAHLVRIAAEHPDWIRGPFGVGAMVAFTPFDGEPETAKRVVHALFDAGVIGFTAGSSPARVRFLVPAGAATEQDVDEVCTVLKDVMDRLAADR